MSQQVLDLRRSIQIVQRHRVLVGIVVAMGILVGGAYAALNPPTQTSSALVVLPQAVQSATTPATAVDSYMATQVVIAGSDPVLAGALPNVRPAMSLQKLRSEVQVKSLTSYIISVSARGKSASDAEATANAVAAGYVAYVGAATSPVGHVPARILEAATTATGSGLLEALLVTALVGAFAGALIGVIVSLAVGRKDKRLRERDEIANSIGVPVVASLPVDHPANAAAWARLLEEYKPTDVLAWRLRQALRQLGIAGGGPGFGNDGSLSLAVISLAADSRALALGPQLAAFAASLGIRTTLVIGPQQDANATAALRAACAAQRSASPPGHLRVAVDDDGSDIHESPDDELTVVVAVVDGQAPQISGMMRTAVTVIGVSAGAATAEQLARTAASAATDHREIVGILVADPDPDDHTTGRVPQLARSPQRRRPRRLSSITTEVRR